MASCGDGDSVEDVRYDVERSTLDDHPNCQRQVSVPGDKNTVIVAGAGSTVTIGHVHSCEEDRHEWSPRPSDITKSPPCQKDHETEARDDCARWLKFHYAQQRQACIYPVTWSDPGFKLRLNDVYTELALVENKGRSQEECSSSRRMLLEKLACEQHPYRILIEGEPGIGKSTFFQKIAQDWTKDSEPTLKRYSLLLLLELSQTVASVNLFDAIIDQLLPEQPGFNRSHLKEFIEKNQEEVMILLDGYDELKESLRAEVMKLIKGKILPKTVVILTSRSTKRDDLIGHVDNHYTIKGFSRDNIISYIDKYFKDDKNSIVRFRHEIDNSDDEMLVLSLLTNPLNTVLFCILWEDGEMKLPGTLTVLFSGIVVSIYRRFCIKNDKPSQNATLATLSQESKEEFLKIGEMAFIGLKEGRAQFLDDQLARFGISKDLILSFGNQVYSRSKLQRSKSIVFQHKTFQEFFAAFYLTERNKIDSGEFFEEIILNSHLHTVCVFVAGLLTDQSTCLFDFLCDRLSSSVEVNTESFMNLVYLTFRCLYETNNEQSFVGKIAPATLRKNGLNFFEAPNTQWFYSALTSVIRHCNKLGKVDVRMKVLSLELNFPTASDLITSEFYDALCEVKSLERLALQMTHLQDRNIASVLSNNASLRDLGLIVCLMQPQAVSRKPLSLTYVNEILSEAKCLKYLKLSIFSVDDSGDFKEHCKRINIGQSLKHFSLYGDQRAEIFFHVLADELAKRRTITSIGANFVTFDCLVARRKGLARILTQNTSITKLIIFENNIYAVSSGLMYDDTIPNRQSIRDTSEELNARKGPNSKFYKAIRMSRSLKYVVFRHWGDERDLKSFCQSVQENNGSLRIVVVVVDNLSVAMATDILRIVSSNKNLGAFCIVNKEGVDFDKDSRPIPRSFRGCDCSSKLKPGEAPLLQPSIYSIWEQWERWFKEITDFEEQHFPYEPSACDHYAKESLLHYILPPIKVVGWQVNVWESK
ncbi:NACHT, LRR and PYD domains-containing protein 3-like [Ptychodera flava]|uniref:NACHT, LRR and PYD domains-containing protein 3-like n=1 Tax=Ptychodera flava TaxID=63121 RepID=UPI00396A85F3